MILITGASGLLGLHLLETLSHESKKVRALYKSKIPELLPNTKSEFIEWMQTDVLHISELENAFEGITHVYHCAAIVSYDPRLVEVMFEVNVEGTANVVNLCLNKGIKKLIHVSSIACIGKPEKGNVSNESGEFDYSETNSNYAKSKFEAEMEVWRGIAEGLNAVIVNPSIILGEGDETKSSTNLFSIVRNEFPYYTNGATGWVDVKDVVQIMVQLMKCEIKNERFILNGENLGFREVFTMMAYSMNVKPPYKYATEWMTEVVWRLSYMKSCITGKTATISKETARSAHQISQFDNEKVLKALPDFKFNLIEDTIQRICAGFVNNNVK